MRSTSSPAARRVNVTASTCRASASSSRTRHAIRRVSTRVLPDPAGARIASGTCVSVTRRADARRGRRAVCRARSDRTGDLRRMLQPRRSDAASTRRRAGPAAACDHENGRAPSSPLLQAARISSGPVPRPPVPVACSPRGRPPRTSTAEHTKPRKTPCVRSARAPVSESAGWQIRSRRSGDPAGATVRPRPSTVKGKLPVDIGRGARKNFREDSVPRS